jgi:hypothetical protein
MTLILQEVYVDAAWYKSIQLRRGVDAIQGQQAACNNHRDNMGVHSSPSTNISKGDVCGNKSIWLYYGPHACFPRLDNIFGFFPVKRQYFPRNPTTLFQRSTIVYNTSVTEA